MATFTLEFDRQNIDREGVSPVEFANLCESLRKLAQELMPRYLGERYSNPVPHDPVTLGLRIVADPERGSLKIRLHVVLLGFLGIAANASQITGFTMRDVVHAFQASNGSFSEKPIEPELINPTVSRIIDDCVARARETGCSTVAISLGNETAYIIGGEGGPYSLVGSQPNTFWSDQTPTQLPDEITGFVDFTFDLHYRGKVYRSFVASLAGKQLLASGGDPSDLPVVVLWGSEEPLPDGEQPYRVEVALIDPRALSHGEGLPDRYARTTLVYVVTGASPIRFR